MSGTKIKDVEISSYKLDITDPCYDRDVWCRLNDVPITPGTYSVTEYKDGYMTDCLVIQNAENEAIERNSWKWEYIGEIGIDAGIAGFFWFKPDFDDSQWREFCDALKNKEQNGSIIIDEYGIYSAHQDDGGYNVYGVKNSKTGNYTALKIEF